ncbi:MAG: hypothetical protein PUB23_04795, partial [Bacilli bacterium]|nr:hypothetical protein [Bacilli bacterium]
MKKSVRFSILLGIVSFGVGVVLSSCGVSPIEQSTNKGPVKVPVYTGMTIKRNGKKSSQKYTDTIKNADGESQDETNPEEGDVPPVDDGVEVPPVETGEDDKEELENDIEDIVKVTVSGDETTKYYVNPGEVFTVEVHIDNPDDCEIQSFTLNGKKYSNYMFNTGSTMELLLLDVTAPTYPGYVEYTIDAIKYIDGVDIKDVKLGGEQTIKAGVKFTKEPTVNVSKVEVGTNSANINLTLSDYENVLKDNEVKIYLSDGTAIVDEKKLNVGYNSITFDNLLMNKEYEYGVFTHYDLIDGNLDQPRVLHTNNFHTLKAYNFINVTAT